MKFYLSGGMEYKTNLGQKWREWLSEELYKLQHSAIDPVKLGNLEEGAVPIQKELSQLKIEGKLQEVREAVRINFFRKDILAIQLADAVVVFYDESVQKGAGTLSEAWEAFREGKPVYVVTELPLENVPTWLIGETTCIFPTFEAFLSYAQDYARIANDIKEAEKVRNEVLAGVY